MMGRLAVFAGFMLLAAGWGEESRAEEWESLPFNDERIGYESRPLQGELQELIERGVASVNHGESVRERLEILLRELRVPVESQVLVYSKTSTNGSLVSPENPRAIYFNDEILVAWVPGGSVFEIVVQDPGIGAVFVTIPAQEKQGAVWERQTRCLQCHVGGMTNGVPGLLLKSVATDEMGKPTGSNLAHEGELSWERAWGGWYVSASKEDYPGMGREVKKTSLFGQYPGEGSDPVALLVLRHQRRVLNLLTRYRYEFVLGKELEVEKKLIEALLCLDEEAFPQEIARTEFAEVFERGDVEDESVKFGLRTLNLKERLFEQGVSPWVLSRTVRESPPALRKRLAKRLLKEVEGRGMEERIGEVVKVWSEWGQADEN